MLKSLFNKVMGRPKKAKPAESSTPNAAAFPIYENAKVMEVLQENSQPGFNRCRMSDGTTKDVPVELFNA